MSNATVEHQRPMPISIPDFVMRLHHDAPSMTRAGIMQLLLLLPIVAAISIDERTVLDINVWVKPLKFATALAIYTLTLAFYACFIPSHARATWGFRWFMLSVEVAIVLEMIWLLAAAANGVPSHFNRADPLLAAIYPLMGLLAVLLTSASAVYAWMIARNADTGLPPALKAGLVWGLALTLPLTVVSAGTLSSLSGHAVGTNDETGLFFFGWLRNGGDLRVAHFFATHALHFIPVFALALAWIGKPSVTAVRVFALLFSAFVMAVFVQALSGQPFLGSLG